MMAEYYLHLKALHVIAMVCWFAGLFYIVRLYIYHVEAFDKEEPERSILINQLKIMQRRLWYGITVPASIFTAAFGLALLHVSQAFRLGWFHMKAMFLIFIFIYHFRCGSIRKKLEKETYKGTSKSLRIFNEVATLMLFAIVLTTYLKQPKPVFYSMAVVFALGVVLFLLFSKRLRAKPKKD